MAVVEEPAAAARALCLAVVLTLVTYLSGVLFPLLGALLGMAAQAPGVYLRFRTRSWWTVPALVAAVSGILLLLFRTLPPVAVYLGEFGLSSLVLDGFLRRRRAGVDALFQASLLTSILLVLLLLGFGWVRGVSPMVLIEQFLRSNIEAVCRLYEQAGMTPVQLQVLRQAANRVAVWAGTFFPTLLLVVIFGFQCLGFGVALLAYRKRCGGTPVSMEGAIPLAYFKLPEVLIWGVIIGLGGELLLRPEGVFNLMLLNGVGILLFAYLLQGLAIIQFACEAFAVGQLQRFLVFFFFMAFQFLFIIPVLLGIFDIWVDFRRRIVRRTKGSGS